MEGGELVISEHCRVELAGKIVSVTIDETCVLTFWGLVMGTREARIATEPFEEQGDDLEKFTRDFAEICGGE